MTWEYIFIGTGMKTGTGMGTGIYSLFTPSSTSVDTDMQSQNICVLVIHKAIIRTSSQSKIDKCASL